MSPWSGLDAGAGINAVTELRYYALLTTAAQFNTNDWRWLGPLNLLDPTSIALLVNDAGRIAGYGGIHTGDPVLDALRPTHAFRAPASGAFDGSSVILTDDLGVLPGGLHSFPRAMNLAGDLVGYSDFDVTNTGGLAYSPYNLHAVFWGLTNRTPVWLTNPPPSAVAPYGYGDAFAINDSNQIAGASMTATSQPIGVLWQLNHNTNGDPFWEITDLNNRLTDPSWQVFRAVGINNEGLILAYATSAKQEQHAVLLIPGALRVDANRDGQIDDNDDITSAATPYRFWLNDDQDESTKDWKWTEEDPEIYESPQKHRDSDDQIINSPRDCEDLSRLWLDTGAFANYLSAGSGDIYVGLKWKNTAGTSPAIRLFRSMDTSGGLGHIKDARAAALQASELSNPIQSPNHCLLDATAPDFAPIPSNAIDRVEPTGRPADFIFKKNAFTDPNDVFGPKLKRLFLLFEGVTEGKGELRLVLLKKNSNGSWTSVGEGPGVWLDLKNIRRMYVRAHSTPLPENFPLPWQKIASQNPPAFPYAVSWMIGSLYIPEENLGFGYGDSTVEDKDQGQYPFEAPADEQKKCVVFVHGIDLDVPTQQGYSQTFYKRLWWEGYRGRFVAFRWCTTLDAGAFDRFADRENVSVFNSGEYRSWNGGTSLLKYVNQFRSDYGNDWVVSVAAHSLGNACVGAALRQGMQVNSYVAMEAAVPLSCFYPESENPPTDSGLVRADNASPTPRLATELGYQGYLTDIGNSAVHLTSYYNADDFWLITGTLSPEVKSKLILIAGGSGAWLYNQIKDVNWMANQKKYKPDNRFGFGKYTYDSSSTLLFPAQFLRGNDYVRPISDPLEGMAFVGRSRTRPLGGIKPPLGLSALELESAYLFDAQRSCHSGQFQRNIQLMYGDFDGTTWPEPFYHRLMRDLEISP